MIRISSIFVAICMVLVAASLGLLLHSVIGINAPESAIVSLAALTILILYNAVSMRLRDRSDVGGQISGLSQGTTDLARQVAEFGRRLAAIENRMASANHVGNDRIQTMAGEISELGVLVKQLADSVATHDDLLATGLIAAPVVMPPADFAHDPEPAPIGVGPATAPPPAPPAPQETPWPAAASPPPNPAPVAAALNAAQILTAIRNAIETNRLDIYLQPMVTLPQRKVRFYEAVTRLRDPHDQILAAEDFIATAETAGLMGKIDHMVLLRCVQVLRRLMVRNKDVGMFCNISVATLTDPASFAQCLDFLEANRALAPSLLLEVKQSTLRNLGPTAAESMAALAQRGYRFSIDHVTDLRFEPRELADRGVRFIKVPAALLLDQQRAAASDIHPSDLSDLLGRFGIDLVAERIEGERAVVDLLDYDVRFGQGFLFAAPRPLRPEATSATGGPPPSGRPQDHHASQPSSPSDAKSEPPKTDASRTLVGNAALVRRANAPG